jgi:hypothetical protein
VTVGPSWSPLTSRWTCQGVDHAQAAAVSGVMGGDVDVGTWSVPPESVTEIMTTVSERFTVTWNRGAVDGLAAEDQADDRFRHVLVDPGQRRREGDQQVGPRHFQHPRPWRLPTEGIRLRLFIVGLRSKSRIRRLRERQLTRLGRSSRLRLNFSLAQG